MKTLTRKRNTIMMFGLLFFFVFGLIQTSAESFTVEAETGHLSSGSFDNNHTGYTGTGFANTDNELGTYLELSVTFSSEGNYNCTIRYSHASGVRPADIVVNGTTITNVAFNATGSWDKWETHTVELPFISGTNALRLVGTSSSSLPNIDNLLFESLAQQYSLNVQVSPPDYGTVALNPPGGSYAAGTQVRLTAAPASGNQFDNWSGDLTGMTNPQTLTMNANKSVTANFSAICVAPSITSQPVSRPAIVGDNAVFSVSAAGTNLSFQWEKNQTPIPGAASSSHTVPDVTYAMDGDGYRVIVNGDCGGPLTSETAWLDVSCATLSVTAPQNATVIENTTVSFSVSATGSSPIAYQWQENGTDISGANSSSYSFIAQLADDSKQYRCKVTDACGEYQNSASATLSVTKMPVPVPGNQKLSISGELYDNAGNPLGNPTAVAIDMTISLFTDKTAGQALYTETFLAANGQAVTIDDGLFVVRLGEGTANASLREVVAANASLWVEITVDDGTPDVLSPRTPLTASPYSLGVSSVLHGQGNPTMNAAIGTYYVNDSDGKTWFRANSGWLSMD